MKPDINDQQAIVEIANQIAPIDAAALRSLVSKMARQAFAAGESLFRAGDEGETEYFVLSGLLRILVNGHDGKEVTLGFYKGPGVLSPAVTRSEAGRARVDCMAIEKTVVVRFSSAALVALMQASNEVQMWGDVVLRQELIRRANREWALSTMTGAQRLAEFRQSFGNLEDSVPHSMIASYLGITPVTLSRLRTST